MLGPVKKETTMPNSPYYLIDAEKFDGQLEELKKALAAYWNNYVIAYSYKTNSLPWVIRRANAAGAYAEVVSDDEFLLAKKIDAIGVVYNGIAKSEETFIRAVTECDIVNIDSWREIDWLAKHGIKGKGVGVRVNFDLEKLCPGESACGNEGGRFGFCYENGEFAKALSGIAQSGNEVVGLHLHASSRTRSTSVYRAIASIACKAALQYGLKLRFVDVGGGFFGGMEGKPVFGDYLKVISEQLREVFSPSETALIVEPGMSVAGPSVSFVTTVVDVKDTPYGSFAVTDGSRCQVDPLMRKSSYFYRIERLSSGREFVDRQVVCGYTCMENDRLFVLSGQERLCPGDRIIYEKVGAYTMCLAPLFIKYFPAVYVSENGETKCVRKRWTCDDYMSGDER